MAGGVFNKIMNFIGLEENLIEEDIEQEEYKTDKKYQEELEEPYFQSRQKKGKIVNIHTASNIKVVVYQPLTYEDTQTIIDNLRSRKPVIINLDALDIELAQRVLDFISGAVYALDGSIQKVAKGIFVVAPSNVDISGNIPEELKGKSFYTLVNKREDE